MAKTLKKSMKKPHRKISRQKRRTQKRGGETTNSNNKKGTNKKSFLKRAISAVGRLKDAGRVLDLQAIIGEMSTLEFRRLKKNMVLLSDDQSNLTGTKNNEGRTKNNEDRFTEWNTSDEAIKEEAAKAPAEAAKAPAEEEAAEAPAEEEAAKAPAEAAKAPAEAPAEVVPAAKAPTPTGGKWSKKYKRSINCRRPKGFSQRQHCKYGRKSRKSRK
jgi:uncharacterized membrane protein YqiK